MFAPVMRRVLLVIPNVVLLTALLFWGVFSLLGTPVGMMLGEDADAATIAELNEAYGFNRPVWEQYLDWMWNALHGDFGRSFTTSSSSCSSMASSV